MSPDGALGGFLPIDKPQGITSAKALARARFLMTESLREGASGIATTAPSPDSKPKKLKAGHSGTLDPMATGILPAALGEATAFIPYLSSQKSYTAEIVFGVQTDSDDADGEIIARATPPDNLSEVVRNILPKYCGLVEQTAPAYSALKYRGKPLYDYARKNIPVPAKVRKVQVHQIDLLPAETNTDENSNNRAVSLNIVCESGFYVRSLARQLGEELGCGAYLSKLRRTLAAGFKHGITLDDLAALPPAARPAHIAPVEAALLHLPESHLSLEEVLKLAAAPKAKAEDNGEMVRLFTDGRFAGLGCRQNSSPVGGSAGILAGKKMLKWVYSKSHSGSRVANPNTANSL